MPEYRIPYYDIPWSTLLVAAIVKFIWTFFVRPFKWVKDAKYYRKRRRWLAIIITLVGLSTIAFLAEWLTRAIAGVSLVGEIHMFLMEL